MKATLSLAFITLKELIVMEKSDAIRLITYTAVTVVYLTIYNVVLAANAFMCTTDFRLYGSLIIVFSWIILMMLDLSLTIGSFSVAWITVVAIGLGLVIIGFGIYMIAKLYNWDYRHEGGAAASLLKNSWSYGLFVAPILGGVATNTIIIWKLKGEALSWWIILVYIVAYAVCVPACAIFKSSLPAAITIAFSAFCIANIVVGIMTVKEVFF